MKHKKSVLKILSANSECFRVSAGIAPNYEINAIKASLQPNSQPSLLPPALRRKPSLHPFRPSRSKV